MLRLFDLYTATDVSKGGGGECLHIRSQAFQEIRGQPDPEDVGKCNTFKSH